MYKIARIIIGIKGVDIVKKKIKIDDFDLEIIDYIELSASKLEYYRRNKLYKLGII